MGCKNPLGLLGPVWSPTSPSLLQEQSKRVGGAWLLPEPKLLSMGFGEKQRLGGWALVLHPR